MKTTHSRLPSFGLLGCRPGLALVLCLVFNVFGLHAASPFAGFYTGYVYLSVSGSVTVQETAVGAAGFTVDSDGRITGSLLGSVNDTGAITWLTNATGFTNGTISGPVLSALTKRESGGVTTTQRIAATNTARSFGGPSGVAQSLVWRRPTPSGSVLKAITFGGGRFVAVGTGGNVASSADGTNWLASNANVPKELVGIAYGNGTYVAVGVAATVVASPDGITWGARSMASSPLQNFVGVAYGNGTFVAVNLVNEIFTSPDGNAWTKVANASFAGFWNTLKFVGGRFVLVGQKDSLARISTSDNGTTWTAEVTPALGGAGFTDVTFGNGAWLAIGAGGNKAARFTTPTASDITLTDVPGIGRSLGYVDGHFVSENRYFSSNGTSWRRFAYPTAQVRAFANGNGLLVAVGDAITTTLDGTRWSVTSRVLPLAPINNVGINGPVSGAVMDEIDYTNPQGIRRLIRLGVGGLIDERASITSPFTNVISPTSRTLRDGVSLTDGSLAVGDGGTIVRYGGRSGWTNVPAPTTANLLSIAAADGLNIVTVGGGGTILRSSNGGQTWSAVNSGTSAAFNRVVYAQGTGFNYYVAAGDGGILRKSTDGITWTPLNAGTTKRLVGVGSRTAGAVKLVAIADDSTVYASENHGTNWTTVEVNAPYRIQWGDGANAYGADGFQMSAPDNGTNWSYALPKIGPLYGVGYGNGRFVILGGLVRVMSTDLERWTATPVSSPQYGITFGNGLLVSVGGNSNLEPRGYINTSVDGLEWTDRPTPTQLPLNAVTFGQDRFVAVGESATILSSTDGINWVNRTVAAGSALRGVAYGNGVFAAVGPSGTLRTSTNGEAWSSSASTGASLNSVTFAKGMFVAVGDNGAIRTSTNGITWTTRSATPSFNSALWSIRFAGGRFIGVGNLDSSGDGAVLVHSTDGTNWTKEVSNIAFALRSATSGSGQYVAVGDAGTVVSTAVQETNTPAITSQPLPASQTVTAGTRVQFRAGALGSGLQFRWFKDGTPLSDGPDISGATTPTLTLSSVSVFHTGRYALSVWNESGSALSDVVSLEVNGPPVVITPPLSASVALLGTTNFTVVAAGPGPFTYQWRFNGTNLVNNTTISGATSSTLTVSKVTALMEGAYDVIVSNAYGSSAPSVAASLGVNRPPSFLQPPQSVNLVEGESFLLSAVVDGTKPLSFQWKRNGVALTNDARISGATNLNLSLTGAGVADTGSYTLTVTNAFGPAVTSTVAFVNVLGPGAFQPLFTFNGTAAFNDLAPAGDGNFLLGGDGSVTLGGVTWQRLIKIDPNGKPISNFGTTNNTKSPGGTVRTIAVQPDGRIVIGGNFFQLGGINALSYAARFSADGVLDTTFQPNPGLIVKKVVALPDGKLLIGKTGLGFSTSSVRRHDATGAVDPSFTEVSNPNRELHGLALQSDGTVWMSGVFGLKRAGASGANPTSIFTYAPFPEMYTVFVGPDDKVYYSDNNGQYFGRLNADGSRDTTFNAPINGHVEDIAFLPDGRLVIVGGFQLISGTTNAHIAVLESTGKVAPGFTSPYTWVFGNSLNSIAMLPDGSALVAGNIQITLPTAQRFVQRVQVLPHTAPPTGKTFAQWSAESGLPAGKEGPNDDADGDGLSNLAEFALGTPPLQAQARGLPEGQLLTVSGEAYPSLTVIRRKNVTGVSLVVEAFNSIPFGTAVPFVQVGQPEDLGDGTERVTVRSETPLKSLTQYFFRTRITSP